MSIIDNIRDYLTEKTNILGWTGIGSFWGFEGYEEAGGMVLSASMILTSAILQGLKIRSQLNEERRREERHRQELNQDMERHNRDLGLQ
jgi:hypothetical protein